MNKSGIMFVVGVFLVIGAALLLIAMINQVSSETITYEIGANAEANKTVYMHGNTAYTLSFKSNGNLSYAIYSPEGQLIKKGYANFTKSITLNTTETGHYAIHIKNLDIKHIKVIVAIMSAHNVQDITNKEISSLLMCVSGIIVVLAGIVAGVHAKRRGL